MRTTKNSRRTSRVFRHRFDGVGTEAAPVRYLQRAREEMLGAVIHAILLAGFVVALAFFARSLRHLFAAHGDQAPGWVEPVAMVGLAVFVVLVVRRLVAKVHEIRELRQELRELRAQVAMLRQQLRRRD
jgi:hypothetical protein